VGEAGLHQLQVPTVAREALVVAPCCCGQALGTEAPHGRSHGSVGQLGVQDDVEDVVQQRQAPDIGADRLGLALGDPVSRRAVGAGQHHVEEADDPVDDLGVGFGQGGEQDGMASLRGHLAQRPGRGAPGHRGELAEPLGRDGAQVETVGAQALQVGKFRHLSLDPLGRRGGGAVVQPDQASHAEPGVGGHQGVELLAALGGQLWVQAPADLVLGFDPGRGHRPHEPVEAGPDDPAGPQLLEGLAEQHRGRVVLQGTRRQPVPEGLPLAGTARLPPGLFDDRGHVPAPGAAVDLPGVAAEGGRGDPDLFGHERHDLTRRAGEIGRDEAQEAEGDQLHREADALDRTPVGADPAPVLDRQREVGDQIAAGHLGRPGGELLGLVVGENLDHARSSSLRLDLDQHRFDGRVLVGL